MPCVPCSVGLVVNTWSAPSWCGGGGRLVHRVARTRPVGGGVRVVEHRRNTPAKNRGGFGCRGRRRRCPSGRDGVGALTARVGWHPSDAVVRRVGHRSPPGGRRARRPVGVAGHRNRARGLRSRVPTSRSGLDTDWIGTLVGPVGERAYSTSGRFRRANSRRITDLSALCYGEVAPRRGTVASGAPVNSGGA